MPFALVVHKTQQVKRGRVEVLPLSGWQEAAGLRNHPLHYFVAIGYNIQCNDEVSKRFSKYYPSQVKLVLYYNPKVEAI